VLHQIGAGSLGPVFRGDDPATSTPVAIKALHVDLAPERARQVAEALSGLRSRLPAHPAIVVPLDAGLADVVPYLVWPLVPGESLDVALREYGPAAPADALPRLASIAVALDRAAAQGVWHGALHPRDVIVSADDTRVVGLGVAPILERAGVRLTARRPYTAPEQAGGRPSSPPGDQFALAAIAHEWLFSRRVAGPADASLSIPHLPGVDRTRMTDAFARALAADPDARFPSGAEFVQALERAVTDRHEAQVRGEGRAARQRARRVIAPALPLDEPPEAAIAEFARETGDEPDRFTSIDADEPIDAVIREPADAALADGDDGEEMAGAEATPAGSTARMILDDDVAQEPAVRTEPMEVGGAGEHERGRAVEDPDDEWGVAPGIDPGDEEPDRVRRAGAFERRAEASRGVFADTMGPPGTGPFGGGTVVAALFVGLLIGAAAGYALALQQTGRIQQPSAADRSQPMAAPVEVAPLPAEPAASSEARAPVTITPETVAPSEATPPAASLPATGEAAAGAAGQEAVGRLLVRSTPAGAEVRLNGTAQGVTPVTLRDIPFGTHTVTVVSAGFQASEQRVALSPDRPSRSLDVELTRAAAPASPGAPARAPAARAPATSGSLRVESRPAGASIQIDGRTVGVTPMTVPSLAPGSYRVTIVREGYQPWTTTVRVAAGGRARVAASLAGGRDEE
jgi:hypothetical protein